MTRPHRKPKTPPRDTKSTVTVVGQAAPRRPDRAGKGAVTGPGDTPRREQDTDPSIGRGSDEIRLREEHKPAPDQSAIDDAAGRDEAGEEQSPKDRDPMEPQRDDIFPPR